mmetsp:Transcript_2799/g.4335  ORF Transcript_2799/g.4335 Transcript_2799/m.4335 type:complete len:83 (-) Transcript_2799:749-997(-)
MMIRLWSAIASSLLLLPSFHLSTSSSIVMAATPPCGVEPSGGFTFDRQCDDHCSSDAQRLLGPATLPESNYRIAAFYFGYQS